MGRDVEVFVEGRGGEGPVGPLVQCPPVGVGDERFDLGSRRSKPMSNGSQDHVAAGFHPRLVLGLEVGLGPGLGWSELARLRE